MLFIANGPWINWEHSINDPKNGDLITWGTKDSPSALGFYNKLKVGDTVFMANQPPPNNGPYKRKVVFGFGEVVDMGVIHNENNSCIDLLAKSCKHYLSPKDDGR